MVEIPAADLEVLVKVAYECSRAQAGLGNADLAELLAEFQPPAGLRPITAAPDTNPVEALVKVVNTLSFPPDGDMRLLVNLIRGGFGADVVLAPRSSTPTAATPVAGWRGWGEAGSSCSSMGVTDE